MTTALDLAGSALPRDIALQADPICGAFLKAGGSSAAVPGAQSEGVIPSFASLMSGAAGDCGGADSVACGDAAEEPPVKVWLQEGAASAPGMDSGSATAQDGNQVQATYTKTSAKLSHGTENSSIQRFDWKMPADTGAPTLAIAQRPTGRGRRWVEGHVLPPVKAQTSQKLTEASLQTLSGEVLASIVVIPRGPEKALKFAQSGEEIIGANVLDAKSAGIGSWSTAADAAEVAFQKAGTADSSDAHPSRILAAGAISQIKEEAPVVEQFSSPANRSERSTVEIASGSQDSGSSTVSPRQVAEGIESRIAGSAQEPQAPGMRDLDAAHHALSKPSQGLEIDPAVDSAQNLAPRTTIRGNSNSRTAAFSREMARPAVHSSIVSGAASPEFSDRMPVPVGMHMAATLNVADVKELPVSSELNPFAATDAGAHSTSIQWTHAGPMRAEAGFTDPALGWVTVRADQHGGAVHAAITTSTADSTGAVASELAGLHAHLAERHVPVDSVTVMTTGGQSGDLGEMSHSGNEHQRDARGFQQDARDETVLGRQSETRNAGREELMITQASLSGTHVSIRV